MNEISTTPAASDAPTFRLLFDPQQDSVVAEKILPRLGERLTDKRPYRRDELPDWPQNTTVLTCLDDAAIAEFAPQAAARQWRIALLPHPDLERGRLYFGVAERLDEALDDALADKKERRFDLFYCNGQPVFHSVVVGKVFSLGGGQPLSGFGRIWSVLRVMGAGFRLVKPYAYTLVTAKDKKLDTAALGLVMVEEGGSSLLSRRILDDGGSNDGMLDALILAPRSRMEMARFLLASLLPASRRKQLPPFVGHLKTEALTVTSPEPLDYLHDGVRISAPRLDLRVDAKALRLLPGRYLDLQEEISQTKETYKVQGLPSGEAKNAIINKALPWLHRASPEEFRELYSMLRNNARASPAYLNLMVLSAILATIGLFANSAPVIIGAMILAPLMAPIISLAMAVVRQDSPMLATGLKTLGAGILLAVGCAAAMALLVPLRSVTDEIAARLSPTLLDLGVALVSGVAGAYAHARAEIAKSLAGVAIAVALVPPLAVSGIGLGWGDWSVFQGAFLLFLTNLFGIMLAGNLTFLMLGFGPFNQARRGLMAVLLLVAVVSVPLTLGFASMIEQQRVVHALEGQEIEGVVVRAAAVRPGKPMHDLLAGLTSIARRLQNRGLEEQKAQADEPLYLSVRLLSPTAIGSATVERVKTAIETRLERPVVLEATVAISR
ncbi:MAG: TIGR00341 family protein [Candidatus Competibacteraceae bacterium]|nr:TIGR00341 family protein [Candidatus Competibacteraceae bacterium]